MEGIPPLPQHSLHSAFHIANRKQESRSGPVGWSIEWSHTTNWGSRLPGNLVNLMWSQLLDILALQRNGELSWEQRILASFQAWVNLLIPKIPECSWKPLPFRSQLGLLGPPQTPGKPCLLYLNCTSSSELTCSHLCLSVFHGLGETQ